MFKETYSHNSILPENFEKSFISQRHFSRRENWGNDVIYLAQALPVEKQNYISSSVDTCGNAVLGNSRRILRKGRMARNELFATRFEC